MNVDNQVINSLWIGDTLDNLGLLTLKSFVHHGHTFQLWVYDTIKTPLPNEVLLKDANEIIPEKDIFRYKNHNEYGHGKGSVAGFADIFRCKLLYEKGGWWVDMDMTCLKPLDFNEPYVFRRDSARSIVNNMIKCPPKSPIMKWCYQQTKQYIDENNKEWMLPSFILRKAIEEFKLKKYINSTIANPDRWEQIVLYSNYDMILPSSQYVIHWLNEFWRVMKLNKKDVVEGSIYYHFSLKFDLDYNIKVGLQQKRHKYYWLFKLILLKNTPPQIKEWYFDKKNR
jgi:mannosyltransferase OCH1-like enzyme